MRFSSLASLGLLLSAVRAAQHAFSSDSVIADHSAKGFTILSSEHHPKHRVRIKEHHGWCDPNVNSYSGYLDTGDGKNLFFYFFESRSKPAEDPVVMWINGGPGGTSAMGLFLEQGPCRLKENPTGINDTYPNPYAWNERANVFFLDQPIGVGWSHAEHGQMPSDTETAAVDIAAFVAIFFETFKEYEGRPFHMTGESYAGRYLPVFASAVYDQNTEFIKQGKTPINLKSVAVGNGGTSLFKLMESIYPMLCTEVPELGHAALDIKRCVEMKETVVRCKKNLQKYCLDTHDFTSCQVWIQHCEVLRGPSLQANLSRYNVNQTCTPAQYAEYSCLKETQDVAKYLNLKEVRELLGVDDHVPVFSPSSDEVYRAFTSHLDFTHQTYYYVANLLERGVTFLNYAGTLDAACDHFGQALWMDEMEWSGRQGYLAAEEEDWMVDGEVAGSYKHYKNLHFLKVFGAGHLLPMDKPKEGLALLDDHLAWCA